MRQTHDLLFYQSNCDKEKTAIMLVLVSVESALLNVGIDVYSKVVKILKKTHNCDILDCYQHPEYLHDALVKLDKNTYNQIIKSIQKHTSEFYNIGSISKFTYAICK